MNSETAEIIKGILNMLANRVESLEKKVEGLAKEQQATSEKDFEEYKEFFKKELKELDKLI